MSVATPPETAAALVAVEKPSQSVRPGSLICVSACRPCPASPRILRLRVENILPEHRLESGNCRDQFRPANVNGSRAFALWRNDSASANNQVGRGS